MMRRATRTFVTTFVASAVLLIGATSVAHAADTTGSVAHRGDKQLYPDNSFAGIASAVAKGADWIEIDVRYNPSGDTFFLAHDNSCSGPGGSATISSAGAWSKARVSYAESAGLTSIGWAAGCACEGSNTDAINLGLDLFMTDRLDDLHVKLGR